MIFHLGESFRLVIGTKDYFGKDVYIVSDNNNGYNLKYLSNSKLYYKLDDDYRIWTVSDNGIKKINRGLLFVL